MTDNKPKDTYLTEVEKELLDLMDAGAEASDVIPFVREKLVQSFKNGIAAGKRRSANESKSD